jgi:hypothetical protein
MQMLVRSALVVCVVLWLNVPVDGLLKRTSTTDSKLQWFCRNPKPDEAQSMKDNGNPNFGMSTSADPIGYSGGCMPDATCDEATGRSAWTNVFGYAAAADCCRCVRIAYIACRYKDYTGASYDGRCAFFGGKPGL